MDGVLIVGAILMCAGAAVTAVLYAVLVQAIPTAAFKALVYVALMLVGSTFVNHRLRNRLRDEDKEDTTWFTVFLFMTQFFLALAWAAMAAAIILMLKP
jgi:uncharacterized membrane protein YfcA